MPVGIKVRRRIRTAVFYMAVTACFLGSILSGLRESPLISIGAIRPAMAFSTVRVRGMLESAPRSLSDGTLFMNVMDATGSLSVFLNSTVPVRRPAAGSWIMVEGSPGLTFGSVRSLRVAGPDRLAILDSPPTVEVRGEVVAVRSPPADSRAPCRITLARPAGRIEVVHWFEPQVPVNIGDTLAAEGTLGTYRNRRQVKVHHAGQLRIYPDP